MTPVYNLVTDESVSATRKKIDQLEEKYDALLIATQKVLRQKSIDIDEFRTKVTRLPRSMKGDQQYQQYITDYKSAFCSASTVDEIVLLLNGYWDYMNYHLLERIVHIYGDEQTRMMMQLFNNDMQSFREKTSLRVFWEAQPKRYTTVPKEFTEIVFKHEKLTPDSSLQEVEDYRCTYAYEYSLPKFTLILSQLRPGCIATVWLMPTSLAISLKDRVLSGEVEFLQRDHILQMNVNGITIYRISGQ